MKADEKVPSLQNLPPGEGIISKERSPSSGLLSLYLYLFFFVGGNFHISHWFHLILCFVIWSHYLGLRCILTRGRDRPSPELPLCTSSSWPVNLPHAKSVLLNTALSKAYSGQSCCEEWRSREGKWAKHCGVFWWERPYYATDACCVKWWLASVSPLAPAQHVCPNSATSITAVTIPYLSGR